MELRGSQTDSKSETMPEERAGIFMNICVTMLIFVRITYDLISNAIFTYIYSKTPRKILPPVSDPLLKESVFSLAHQIRTRRITSEQIVKLFINRIKEVNDIVNAMVDNRFDEAIKEAIAVDELIKSGLMSENELETTKPLLGIPFTSKESVSAEGMSWTKGLLARKGKKAIEDAYVMKRMKESGAILIGVTNIPEFCLWVEARNFVFGQTNNPYDTNRIVGGSSGGEGCIVSCCGSPFGLGTDLGGSIRIPAFCCGVFGHKLTPNLINTKGMLYRDGTEGETIAAVGPITRYAVDLKPISAAFVQPEKIHLLQLEKEVDVKKLKYFYILEPGDLHISPVKSGVKISILNIVRSIKERCDGISPREISLSGFKHSFTLTMYGMQKEKPEPSLEEHLTDFQGGINPFVELFKKMIGTSNFTFATIVNLLSLQMPAVSSLWAEKQISKLKEQLLEKLGDDGVLIFPSSPTTVPYHCQPFTAPFNFGYWGIFNVLKVPTTQIPIGLDDKGLPMGIQVVAAPHQDRLCFAVAEFIESLTGGWVPPFAT